MTRRLNSLMADLLNGQTETVEDVEIEAAAERFAGYVQGKPWSGADQRLLWTSPAARRLYLNARSARAGDIARRWGERGLATELTLRAADSDSEQHIVSAAGITVRILRAPEMNDWLISVLLSQEAASLLGGQARVRIADSGGKVWLDGVPDRTGTLDTYWEDETQTPAERLRTYALQLDFH